MQVIVFIGTAILAGSLGFLIGCVLAASGAKAQQEQLKQSFAVQLGRVRVEERTAGISLGRAEGYEAAEREIQSRIAAARLLEEGS